MSAKLVCFFATLVFGATALGIFAFWQWRTEPMRMRVDNEECRGEAALNAQNTTDPSSVDYDPVALVRLGADPYAVFDAEGIDVAWAEPMQARIGAQLASDASIVAPGSTNPTVVCHSHTCVSSLDVDSKDVAQARAVFKVAQYGDATAYSKGSTRIIEGELWRVSAVLLFHESWDLDEQRSSYERKRLAFLAHVPVDDSVYGELVRRERRD